MNRLHPVSTFFMGVATAIPFWLMASQVGTLTSFQNGETAQAEEVNQNFSDLKAAVNDNFARIDSLEQGGGNAWDTAGSDIYFDSGSVGVGTNAPNTSLHVSGAVRIASDATTCTADRAGTLEWDGDRLRFCNGGQWLTMLRAQDGLTAERAGVSCRQIFDDGVSSGSKNYWLDPDGSTGNPAFEAYCDMTPGNGGWMRVVAADYATDNCPSDWQPVSAQDLCWRHPTQTQQRSATFAVNGVSYDQVRGKARGRQYGSMDAFIDNQNINGYYVEGLSLTRGSPREHIWSFAVGLSSHSNASTNRCPGAGGRSPAAFVANDYFCESGNTASSWSEQWYAPKLWWPSEFVRTLPLATNDDLEGRLMATSTNEDVGIEALELWVR